MIERMSNNDDFVVQGLFRELDQRHFAGRLTRARFRVRMCHLVAGQIEHYNLPNGSRGAYRIEDDGLLGVMVFGARLILVNYHDRESVPRGRDPDVELRNTLLHEMSHAALELERPLRRGADEHGRRFVQQMRRLVAAGESSLREHVRFYSICPLGRLLAEIFA
jgi:hypothetical protein